MNDDNNKQKQTLRMEYITNSEHNHNMHMMKHQDRLKWLSVVA